MKRPVSYSDKLRASDALRNGLLRDAVKALAPQPGSHGLDAGCGIGSPTLHLARAVGPRGNVTGVDVSEEFLTLARDAAQAQGLAERTDFHHADMTALPFDAGTFDWVFSMDCAGYAQAGDPTDVVRELARVTRPGSAVALMAWSSQTLLPGYPALEARLNATAPGLAPLAPSAPPRRHFLRAPQWFMEAGLSPARALALTGTVQAPLTQAQTSALESLLDMRWGGAGDELSPDDARLFSRLCDPDSQEFVLRRPDYCAFFSYMLFIANTLE